MTRLNAAVGDQATNNPPDVKYIQYLLTDWRLAKGGAALAIDGIVGPLTTGAIREFQRAQTAMVDGRIDPNGVAIGKLEYCHLSRIASCIIPLTHLGTLSMTRPTSGGLTVEVQASRYLDGVRAQYASG